ncbi:CesT family type III secretion system chaperone [Horticoccus sp. 23ND18S-11]|uniref:CesT family type III secretion system chaperone n=1 Tax=Horticoccus sp. 23ND18S-11 TaxID=3391832 RepID=UPI0039C8CF7A
MKELESALSVLCEELGLTRPQPDARGRYLIPVGDLELRLAPWGQQEVVLEGVIGCMGENAAREWENQQDLLRQILTWNIARLKGQARPEVLSFDEEDQMLLLWRTWECDDRLPARLLGGAEEMLNELEFWRGKILSVAPTFGRSRSS